MNGAPTLEKTELEIRFIPIACATPLAFAKAGGFFERNGLSVSLKIAPGWSGIKELLVFGRVDAVHMLSPMPLASSLGIDGEPTPVRLCAIQNINGQALVLAKKHLGIRDIRDMRGFSFGVPYLFSMQYYLLCDLLAQHGLDPLSDVVIEEVVPPSMPSYLRKGRLDGVLTPEPYGEISVSRGDGFIHTLSMDMWPGHPCCALAVTQRFAETCPATCRALTRSLIEAERALHDARGDARARVAYDIAPLTGWDDATAAAMARVLRGIYVDRSGREQLAPARIDFIPQPYRAYGVWILSQMQRWGQLQREVDPEEVVGAVFLEEAATQLAADVGFAEAAPALALPLHGALGGSLTSMRGGPFSVFRPAPPDERSYGLPAAAQERMSAILGWLADFTGGEPCSPLEVTSADQIGGLERMLDEAARNTRFTHEAMNERFELEEQARRQQALISAQEALIRELSTPIMPVLDRVLVLPLVGRVDRARAERITEALLAEVTRVAAKIILIDITGVPSMDACVLDSLLSLIRATSLLGAEGVVVGVTPAVAMTLAALGDHAALPRTQADLRSGIEYALRRTGRRIVGSAP